jgi:hypothetical protein
MCTSKSRFRAYFEIILKSWHDIGESEYAKWFQSTYGVDGWGGWWCGASGVLGTSATNNFLEAINRVIKVLVGNQ